MGMTAWRRPWLFRNPSVSLVIHSSFSSSNHLSRHPGVAFIGYLALVFGFLCDIAFNRGRVTTECVNARISAFGGAASLVPC